MPAIVVPFRGSAGKRRLAAPPRLRSALALAMLQDVLAACEPVGEAVVVSSDPTAAELGAEVMAEPGSGQGPAVAAALARLPSAPLLILNADLPCATPRDLLALLGALPEGGLALVEAADGTTNALALASPLLFAPLYGPGSAGRFRSYAARSGIEFGTLTVPNLADDVDTMADLERVRPRVGPHTEAALEAELEPAL
jgi:2-phospho-L-lactate/phosphoenolpyruvate guanylyltransferase